ncbi:MAG: DUF2309 domain-containing protein [Opitutus sp.]
MSMPTLLTAPPVSLLSLKLEPALESALARIPPLWPLRHFVAVNPFVGLVDQPFDEAGELLQRIIGAAPLQSPSDYLQAIGDGRISMADIDAASDGEWTTADLLKALDEAAEVFLLPTPLPTVADWLDHARPRAHWSVMVVEEISKWCAVTFNENQTTWENPWKTNGLYQGWREAAQYDRNAEAFGVTGFRTFVASLPSDADAAIRQCLAMIMPPTADVTDFLHRQLVTIAGWAGYVQYLVREDALRGQANPALKELLAIRLAYDAALLQTFAPDESDRVAWGRQVAPRGQSTHLAALGRWQFAYEEGYQRRLAQSVADQSVAAPAGRPPVQAVFCIDVRSEVFRRRLEAALPDAQTIGFAGFFGFPVAHQPAGAPAATSRCPVLLVPPVNSIEPQTPAEFAATRSARAEAGAWKAFQNSAASCFSFVESAGLAFSAALGRTRARVGPSCSRVAPDFESAPLETRVALAAGALRNMGLIRNFARTVLICGHGSQSVNNPHASSLDCGACGGHAGDINARLTAATLNDPAVRRLLAGEGLEIPDDTFFFAGLHNTTTDDVILFDLESVPASHLAELETLRRSLAAAGAASRRERAPLLGLSALADVEIDAAVRARAADIAQVRPEWGLARNAAFIAAPRRRTAKLDLEGRVFLHDYDSSADPDDKVLTLILCAPVVVASWINLQYYASRIDPLRYGSGNKVLHNVVGGVGVVEGNGGDLRSGLPLQSIHDGNEFIHEPRRLAVYLEAPPSKIASVLEKNPAVKQLFDHGWIHLWAIHDRACYRFREGDWREN